jgi:NAD-dependent deacetylase
MIERLRRARSTVMLTGAGASAESGIPTFRDAMTGLWSRYSPETLASPEGFADDPALVWRWYEWRRKLVRGAQPNAGHLAITELQSLMNNFTLVTQNVDGLHQRAGSRTVLELHGNLFENLCSGDGLPVEATDWTEGRPPRCPRCGAAVRPGVVWFGEVLPETALVNAQAAAVACEIFFSVGTSALVYPAAELAEIALRSGAIVIEINPEPTPLTRLADYVIAEPSARALPRLCAALRQSQKES